ncbi:MAG: ferritin [Melioribacteraceae bacterium]|jgi:ferritin|nr:ferritin [Melioribacteraceae bacterium]
MISKKMEEALNKQLNAELFSSYLYLAMAAYLEDLNLNGMASWMRLQSQEEYEHGLKFYEYIGSVGKRVKLEALETPQFEWKNPQEAFEAALAHEKKITKNIYDLSDLAVEEKDHATRNFLNWFVDEQVEEVASVTVIVEKFKMVSDSKNSLYLLDKELGKRGQK